MHPAIDETRAQFAKLLTTECETRTQVVSLLAMFRRSVSSHSLNAFIARFKNVNQRQEPPQQRMLLYGAKLATVVDELISRLHSDAADGKLDPGELISVFSSVVHLGVCGLAPSKQKEYATAYQKYLEANECGRLRKLQGRSLCTLVAMYANLLSGSSESVSFDSPFAAFLRNVVAIATSPQSELHSKHSLTGAAALSSALSVLPLASPALLNVCAHSVLQHAAVKPSVEYLAALYTTLKASSNCGRTASASLLNAVIGSELRRDAPLQTVRDAFWASTVQAVLLSQAGDADGLQRILRFLCSIAQSHIPASSMTPRDAFTFTIAHNVVSSLLSLPMLPPAHGNVLTPLPAAVRKLAIEFQSNRTGAQSRSRTAGANTNAQVASVLRSMPLVARVEVDVEVAECLHADLRVTLATGEHVLLQMNRETHFVRDLHTNAAHPSGSTVLKHWRLQQLASARLVAITAEQWHRVKADERASFLEGLVRTKPTL